MSLDGKPEIEEWGPPKLRAIIRQIKNRLTLVTPKQGTGITIDQRPDGVQISLASTAAPAGTSGGDGSGVGGVNGTNVNLYGAFNGDPAIFHLKQSSAPTVLP